MIARIAVTITIFALALAGAAACRAPAGAAQDPTQESSMISKEQAIEAARAAIEGKVELSPGGGVEVVLQGNVYVVTFTRNDPPGTRGPDYDARVKIDARTGNVTELLGSS
jgi:hypothetical protein